MALGKMTLCDGCHRVTYTSPNGICGLCPHRKTQGDRPYRYQKKAARANRSSSNVQEVEQTRTTKEKLPRKAQK